MILHLLSFLLGLISPKIFVIESCGSPYMIRLSLIFGYKLHIFLRSDFDRELHDHPWSFRSLVIAGEYYEEVPAEAANRINSNETHLEIPDGQATIKAELGNVFLVRRAGDCDFRPAEWKHRVHIRKPCVTLVKVGGKKRDWGFWKNGNFIPWRNHVSEREC